VIRLLSAVNGDWFLFDHIVYRVHFFCPDHHRNFEMSQQMGLICHAKCNILHTHVYVCVCVCVACVNNTDQTVGPVGFFKVHKVTSLNYLCYHQDTDQ